MGKYCYSREIDTIEGKETFAMVDMASFDEAKKEVDKGIRDRRLELADKHFEVNIPAPTGQEAVQSKDNANLAASYAPADIPNSTYQRSPWEKREATGGAS